MVTLLKLFLQLDVDITVINQCRQKIQHCLIGIERPLNMVYIKHSGDFA